MTTSNALKHQLTPGMLLCQQSNAEEIQTHKPISWFQSPQSLFFFFFYRSHEETFNHNLLKSNLFISCTALFVYSVIYYPSEKQFIEENAFVIKTVWVFFWTGIQLWIHGTIMAA